LEQIDSLVASKQALSPALNRFCVLIKGRTSISLSKLGVTDKRAESFSVFFVLLLPLHSARGCLFPLLGVTPCHKT
jgi:hypothetical protein